MITEEKILIHTCCADCFLNAVQYLEKNNLISKSTEIVSLYYNPNIHPKSEYMERLRALKNTISEIQEKNIKLVVPDYKPKEYIQNIGKEGERCHMCWDLRLRFLFDYAKLKGFNLVTSTLLTSQYQNRDMILKIGKSLEEEYDIKFVEITDSCNTKHTGFYKQNYCGCCFSLTEKMLSN